MCYGSQTDAGWFRSGDHCRWVEVILPDEEVHMDYSKVKINPATRGFEYIAEGELNRRLRLLQDVMNKNNVRVLIFQRDWDGYDRWLNNRY